MIFYFKKYNEPIAPDYHIWNVFKVSAQNPVNAVLVPLEYGSEREHEIVVLKFYIVISALLGLTIFNVLLWKFSNVYKSRANSIMNLHVALL